jgi:hypothetical protein
MSRQLTKIKWIQTSNSLADPYNPHDLYIMLMAVL